MIRLSAGILCALSVCACGGGDGSDEPVAATPSGPGNANGQNAPVIAGTPITLTWEGESYVFSPSAGDVDGDTLAFDIANAPPWAQFDTLTGRLSGVPSPADVGVYRYVRIGVSDGVHEAWLPSFEIRVDPVSRGAVTLMWTPPNENVDDSLLEDLSGFNVYWGTQPGELAPHTSVPGAGITSHFIEGLEPGLYFFALTAINAMGIESELSDHTVILVR
jgi:hypothetical protein